MEREVVDSAPPLVSIIILYCRRPETVGDVLQSVSQQDYLNREIIVVDNHSQDDLKQIIRTYGGEVSLIELPANLGACAGRNAGIHAARGQILVFLDDDMSFDTAFELSKIVKALNAHPEFHALAFRVCDPKTGRIRPREWCHTRPWSDFSEVEFETDYFCEGASALRHEVFEKCGLYYEPLFFGTEGVDLTFRLLDRGFRILYTPGIRVKHWASERGRTLERQYYSYTRNYIWTAYKDFHLWDGLVFLVPKMLMMLYFAWRSGVYRPFLRGVWDGIKGLRRIRVDRTPICESTVRYLDQLEKWRPSLMVRLAKHRREPLI